MMGTVISTAAVCGVTTLYALVVLLKARRRRLWADLVQSNFSRDVIRKIPEGPQRDLCYLFGLMASLNFGRTLCIGMVVSKCYMNGRRCAIRRWYIMQHNLLRSFSMVLYCRRYGG